MAKSSDPSESSSSHVDTRPTYRTCRYCGIYILASCRTCEECGADQETQDLPTAPRHRLFPALTILLLLLSLYLLRCASSGNEERALVAMEQQTRLRSETIESGSWDDMASSIQLLRVAPLRAVPTPTPRPRPTATPRPTPTPTPVPPERPGKGDGPSNRPSATRPADPVISPTPAPPPIFGIHKRNLEKSKREIDASTPMFQENELVSIQRTNGSVLHGRVSSLSYDRITLQTASQRVSIPFRDLARESRIRVDASERKAYVAEKALDETLKSVKYVE